MGSAKDEALALPPSAPVDPENESTMTTDISKMLREGKEKGAVRRKRITGTSLLVGSAGLITGGLIRALFVPGSIAAELFSLVLMYISVVVLFLGALPTDYRVIKVLNWIVVCAFLAVGLVYGAFAAVLHTYDMDIAPQFLVYASTANVWLVILLFCKATRCPPRERLDTLWRTFSFYLIGSAFIAAGYRVLLLMTVTADDPRMDPLAWVRSGWYVLAVGAIGVACGWPNFRMRAQAWLSSRGETRSLAAAVATAIGGHSVEETQQKAGKLLRYVTLDKISKEELAENKPNPLLYERSMQGTFGEVDAFISHSWSDPSDSKWDGLQSWRNAFKRQHGREPRVWFDKCCIDQMNIDDSLMCLPVHLAACKKVLMLVGPSYLTRLWCIMEIFVLIAAVNDPTRIECIPVQAFTENSKDDAEDKVGYWFSTFKVNACQCYNSNTRDKLLSIIEAGCGTLDSFNGLVRNIQLPFFALTSQEVDRNSAEYIVKPDAINAELGAEAA